MTEEQNDIIAEACKEFPDTFGLKAWPGYKFRIDKEKSYIAYGNIYLFTQRYERNEWNDWTEGTPDILKQVIVQL